MYEIYIDLLEITVNLRLLKTKIMSLSTDAKAAQMSWIDILKEQVGSLRYGIVQIVVHDRRVVQIERTEKFRFDKAEDRGELSK